MASLSVKRFSLKRVIVPLALYAAGCLIVGLLASTSGDEWLPTLFVLGGITSLLAWRLMQWPDQWARYVSFGALFLLVCAFNRVLYIADYLLSGTRFNEWPFYVESPQLAIFKGEVITVLGTLATVLAWKLSGGNRVSPSIVMGDTRFSYLILVVAYVIAISSMFGAMLMPAVIRGLGQILPTVLGMGLVCAFIIPNKRLRNSFLRVILVSVMSAPFLVLAAGTGMKENMIVALLPAMVSAWQYFRHPILRVSMIVVALLGLGLITAYVNFYRAEVWYSKDDSKREVVFQDFLVSLDTDGMGNVIGESIPKFIRRNNASVHRGWAVSIADERAHYPELVFAPMLYVFIPRILWSEKPPIRQGWEFSGLVFGERYMARSESSTAAGLYPSLYLGGGLFAVIVGAVLIGFLLAKTSLVAIKIGGPTAAGLYIMSMAPVILRLDETWSVGAISGPVIGCAYTLLIVGVAKLFATVMPRAAVTGLR